MECIPARNINLIKKINDMKFALLSVRDGYALYSNTRTGQPEGHVHRPKFPFITIRYDTMRYDRIDENWTSVACSRTHTI